MREMPHQITFAIAIYAVFVLLLLLERNVFGYVCDVLFKGLASVMFCVIAYLCYRVGNYDRRFSMTLLAAFAIMFVADLAMVYEDLYAIAIVIFLVGHIFLVAAFMMCQKISLLQLAISAITIVFSIVVLTSGLFNCGNLFPFVIAYSIVISIMLGSALSLIKGGNNRWFVHCISFGAVLFFLSDFLLLIALFVEGTGPMVLAVSNISYYLGQGLLAVSILGQYMMSES